MSKITGNEPAIASEKWRDICGYEDLYEVSNMGNVRSKGRKVEYITGRVQHYHPSPMRLMTSPYGYLVVGLSKQKKLQPHNERPGCYYGDIENIPNMTLIRLIALLIISPWLIYEQVKYLRKFKRKKI